MSINKKIVPVKRSLISVYDKSGLQPFVEKLTAQNIEIVSTGGTAKAIRDLGISVIDISDFTGFPEVMDGRVKTINPHVEGGILGLRDKHSEDAIKNNIHWIDLVVCNLYPFHETISRNDCNLEMALENVDVGGPTMIRSAAKNLGWVGVVVDPFDYLQVADEIASNNGITFDTRKNLSTKAFSHTAQYDAIIHDYLEEEKFPEKLTLTFNKDAEMRYGENPHQAASSYKVLRNRQNNILSAKIHQGKKLSYNNIMDADAALACLSEFDENACVIVKHATPCGVAIGKDQISVYSQAFQADSMSAFGGVIALNQTCTADTAKKISEVFVEILIAPDFESKALEVLSIKKNLRVLEVGNIQKPKSRLQIRDLKGGVLVQETDISTLDSDQLKKVTNVLPSKSHIMNMQFGWKVLKHIKSNAILIVKDGVTIGVGAGQVSRLDAVNIALKKSGSDTQGCILCSDGFFPFRDSIDMIADSGIEAVIQPGGSVRDEEVIDACNDHGISMVFTGQRCFKH